MLRRISRYFKLNNKVYGQKPKFVSDEIKLEVSKSLDIYAKILILRHHVDYYYTIDKMTFIREEMKKYIEASLDTYNKNIILELESPNIPLKTEDNMDERVAYLLMVYDMLEMEDNCK